MKIRTLKIFCDLVDTESFSEAARKNQVTQSAVSQQIKALEDRYGVRFFERSRKNFSITPEGQLFHEYARDIFDTYLQIEDKLSLLGERVSGRLVLGAIPSFGLNDLPFYEKKYNSSFPDVEIEVQYLRSEDIYRQVREGKIDIGLVAYPKKQEDVVIDVFAEQELLAVFAADHELAATDALSFEQLGKEKYLAFESARPIRRAVDRAARAKGVDLEPTLEFDNIEMLKRGIRVVGGVAVLPDTSIAEEVADGVFAAKPIQSDPPLKRPLATLRRKGKPTSHAMQEFLKLIGVEQVSSTAAMAES